MKWNTSLTILDVVITMSSGVWTIVGTFIQSSSTPLSSSGFKPSWLSIEIAFIIFVLSVAYGWISASVKLSQQKDTHPNIKVSPKLNKLYFTHITRLISHIPFLGLPDSGSTYIAKGVL